LIGASLPVQVGSLIGRALGSRILQTSILRGASNVLADPTVEVPITEGIDVNIQFNEKTLLGTAGASTMIFAASTLFFMRRVNYADRLFAAANLFRDVASSTVFIRSEYARISSLASDLDGGILRGQTLIRSIQMAEGNIRREIETLEVMVQLITALNDPSSTKAEIRAIGTRLNILSGFDRTIQQNVLGAYKLIDDTSLDPDLQRQFRTLFGDDALGLKLVIDDLRTNIDDMGQSLRRLEAMLPETDLDSIRSAVLRGDITVLNPSEIDRGVARVADDAVAMASQTIDEVSNLETSAKIADNLAGGKTKVGKAAKAVGRFAGKALLVDTVIWGFTGAIDLGLNLFLPEEEQGIFNKWVGGFSPVGEAVTWIATNVWNFFVDPEVAETIQAIVFSTIIAAANADDVEGVLATIISWFVEEVSPTVNINLDFEVEQQIVVNPFANVFAGFDVEDILLAAYLAITAKLVWKYWVSPGFASLRSYL